MQYVWLFFILELFLCKVLGTNYWNPVELSAVSVGIIFFTTIIFIFCSVKQINNKTEYLFLMAAYGLRIFLMFFDLYGNDIFRLPGSGGDSEGFYRAAVDNSQGFSNPYGRYYTLLLGKLFLWIGDQRIIGQYINVLFGITAIVICHQILMKLQISAQKRFIVMGILSFAPNFAIMNSILLRESIIVFSLAVSLYFFIIWWRNTDNICFILAVVFAMLATLFHNGASAVVLGYLVIFVFYKPKEKEFSFSVKSMLLLLFFLFLSYLFYIQFEEVFFTKFQSIDSVDDLIIGKSMGRGGAGYTLIGISTGNSLFDFILNSPLRVFYFIASPLPWQWRGIEDIIAFFFSAVLYMICYVQLIKAIKENHENKNLLIAFGLLMLASAVMFAWGVGNAGTALRHRDKFIIVYMVALGICLDRKRWKIKKEKQ